MKVSRYKKAQKRLALYKNYFGFHTPYHVVLDGTFCLAALNNKINLQDQIGPYLGDEVKLLTTACIINELEKLGRDMKGVLFIVKQFQPFSCGHEKKPIPAGKCLTSLVQGGNPNHHIICTQDDGLMKSLENQPGCPVIVLRSCALTLRRPSPASREVAANPEKDKEILQLKELKKDAGLESEEKKKKRKKKGPNPLSCLPKKKKITSEPESKTSRRKRTRRKHPNLPYAVDKFVTQSQANHQVPSNQ